MHLGQIISKRGRDQLFFSYFLFLISWISLFHIHSDTFPPILQLPSADTHTKPYTDTLTQSPIPIHSHKALYRYTHTEPYTDKFATSCKGTVYSVNMDLKNLRSAQSLFNEIGLLSPLLGICCTRYVSLRQCDSLSSTLY